MNGVSIHYYHVRGKINPKAHFNKHGNIKLGKTRVWSFSTLNRADKYVVTDDFGNTYSVFGACGHYCNGCAGACYVNKSYRYNSVVKCHAENTLAFVMDYKQAFIDLENQIRRAKKKPAIIRINQSGEMLRLEWLRGWLELARKFPDIHFWFYTKAYDLLSQVIDNIPSNLFVNISIWHEFGIDEFKRMSKRSKQVAAFVYRDSYDYSKHGLVIRVMCPAYDKDGKMDHSKPCSKCGLCMHGYGLVIGCYDH